MRGRQPLIVAVLAALSGVLAAVAGCSPTGSVVIDSILVTGAAAAVTWAAATAPWWAVGGACAIAATVALQPVPIAIALTGWAAAFFVGIKRRNLPWVRAAAALTAVQVLARLSLGGFLGLSALIACLTLGALFVVGVLRRERPVRRRVWTYVVGVAATAAVAVAGLTVAALAARGPLEEGNRQAHAGLDALNRGEMAAAADAFRSAAAAFRKADDDISAPWAQPSRFLPVVAQHRDGATAVASSAAAALGTAEQALRQIDPEALRLVNGRLDLDAVRALVTPFTELRAAIGDIGDALDETDSPWLVAPLQRELDELAYVIAEHETRADSALMAVQVAPSMLGADGPRYYFVAFTTPAEARGLGGFMGNWAEITIDDGRISMSGFGRTADLNEGGPDPGNRRLTGLDGFVQRWGRFGFFDPADGTTAVQAWSNITMPPDFPMVGNVIAQLYPQSGGREIDGAFAMDPLAMAALISLTGPIQLEGVAEPLTSTNAADFIIRDQYQITETTDRIDLLDEIARTAVERLLTTDLPPPAELARTFGPLTQQDRLVGWSAHQSEQALFEKIGMAGSFPHLDGGDGVAVVIDNAGGNKIDAYLDVAVDYQAGQPGANGSTTGTITIGLTNNAPSAGLPRYVIGNAIGLPLGTNQMFLSVYTGLPMVAVSLDGTPSTMETGTSLDWNVASTFLGIAPGQERTLVLEVSGVLDEDAALITRIQPMARGASG